MIESKTGYWHPDELVIYPKDRECSRGKDCITYEQTARWGEPEVGKVRRTREHIAEGIIDEEIVPIVLCGLCERAYNEDETSDDIYQFTGIQKKGRTSSYLLPKLRKVRRSQGLRQRDLAFLVNCATETIAKAERAGERRVRLSTKLSGKLARALGVKVEELRGELR